MDTKICDLLVASLPAIIWTTDQELRITACGGMSFIPYERRPEELIGITLSDYFGTGNTAVIRVDEHKQVLQGIPLTFDAEYNDRTFAIKVSPLIDENAIIIGTAGVALDVTDRKASEEALRYLATHDPLTDLANYRALLSSFAAELQRSDRTSRPFATLLLDVDGLKTINDRYGHLTGTRTLSRVANVLKHTCRSIDTVSRYGGDEFAVILVETDEVAAHRVAHRIKDALERDQEDPPIMASVGIAVYPGDGYTVDNLLARADQMLYRNKMRLKLRTQVDSPQIKTRDEAGLLGAERRRSERISLDVDVIVRGETPDKKPFQEETFTISVSAHGALLMLASKVAHGQELLVRNQLTNNEKIVRVAHFGISYGGTVQVGVEFPEPAADFWCADVRKDRGLPTNKR